MKNQFKRESAIRVYTKNFIPGKAVEGNVALKEVHFKNTLLSSGIEPARRFATTR